MFYFFHRNKTIESGSRVLSKMNTKYLFYLVTRDHKKFHASVLESASNPLLPPTPPPHTLY
jgi:hypothetical protein